MPTAAATRSRPRTLHRVEHTVATVADLQARGYTEAAIRAQIDARRWRRFGRAVLLHNGAVRRTEAQWLTLLNCGPRALLTAFTAVELLGLNGWQRDMTHVLVPGGTKIRRVPQLSAVVHYAANWSVVRSERDGVHAAAPALVVAAGSMNSPRSACGILAAGVQQRLVSADELTAALKAAPRVRHRATLRLAVLDIGQGSEALSEIDFIRLCRRHGLPEPTRQAIRITRQGSRRYLDAEWTRRDGTRVVVEIDGALHLTVTSWQADQLRQNEIVLANSIVLRYPSIVLRTEEHVVIDQLRRALWL